VSEAAADPPPDRRMPVTEPLDWDVDVFALVRKPAPGLRWFSARCPTRGVGPGL
jgi:hypothetical protein